MLLANDVKPAIRTASNSNSYAAYTLWYKLRFEYAACKSVCVWNLAPVKAMRMRNNLRLVLFSCCCCNCASRKNCMFCSVLPGAKMNMLFTACQPTACVWRGEKNSNRKIGSPCIVLKLPLVKLWFMHSSWVASNVQFASEHAREALRSSKIKSEAGRKDAKRLLIVLAFVSTLHVWLWCYNSGCTSVSLVRKDSCEMWLMCGTNQECNQGLKMTSFYMKRAAPWICTTLLKW